MTWENHGEWHIDHKTPVSWGENEDDIIYSITIQIFNHYGLLIIYQKVIDFQDNKLKKLEK